jgi:hypothetical protein
MRNMCVNVTDDSTPYVMGHTTARQRNKPLIDTVRVQQAGHG